MAQRYSPSNSKNRRSRWGDPDNTASPSKRRRVSRWGDGASSNIADTAVQQAAAQLAAKELEVQAQLSALQKRLEAQSSGLVLASRNGMRGVYIPPPLLLDDKGRQVDKSGNVLTFQSVATVKANRPDLPDVSSGLGSVHADGTSSERKFVLGFGDSMVGSNDGEAAGESSSYIDPRIPTREVTTRKQRALNFIKPGRYSKKAETHRLQQLTAMVRADRKHATSSAAISAPRTFGALGRSLADDALLEPEPPEVEWWDAPLLANGCYDGVIADNAISSVIFHPNPLKPMAEAPPAPPQALMLTDQEKRKIRRMRREETQRERRERIREGLEQAPEPRLTLKNMMKVLGSNAVEDPTAVEAKVRAQIAKRQLQHHLKVEKEKLTPEQLKEKRRRKLQEDISVDCQVAIFRITSLEDPSFRFKVMVSPGQHNLTGCALLYSDFNVIIVEGGPKGIRKYKRLLLNRIKWNVKDGAVGSDSEEDEIDEDSPKTRCDLVWEGTSKRPRFPSFKTHTCPTESMARKVLADKKLEHYWDLCRSFDPDAVS